VEAPVSGSIRYTSSSSPQRPAEPATGETDVSERIFNFASGPAVLPEEVLQEARRDIWDVADSGIGVLEHSHRGPVANRIFEEAEADCRAVADIPEDYAILFLQGGASTQFFMLPANFLGADATADYLLTGSWSKKAAKEAARYGKVHVAASSEERQFTFIPDTTSFRWSRAPVYVHFTSNNTIYGTQWSREPDPPQGAWLACDASSDIFSKPLDVRRYGLLYAGAQKNLGPAGATLVVIRRDLLERSVRDLPTMLRYAIHAEHDSRYNTPPLFPIYVMGRVFKWILREGGLEALARRNEEKARLVYDVLEEIDFYEPAAEPGSRSLMNVTFRTPSPELDARFVAEAKQQGLDGLKGHRSVGGMRASIYNAFPRRGCEALARFMKDFAAKNG
jgi:phosphoserine aminotransferase